MESYNIQNYRSQEGKTYSNYVSYFIDRFGTFDTKTIFQLCHIIINHLIQLNINKDIKDIKNNKAIILMKQYDLNDEDINKMCKICGLIPGIDTIQNQIDTTKFRKAVKLALLN